MLCNSSSARSRFCFSIIQNATKLITTPGYLFVHCLNKSIIQQISCRYIQIYPHPFIILKNKEYSAYFIEPQSATLCNFLVFFWISVCNYHLCLFHCCCLPRLPYWLNNSSIRVAFKDRKRRIHYVWYF